VDKFGRVTLREITRIERLLERLRALGQPSAHPPVRVDVRAPVAEAVEFLQPVLTEKGTQLTVRLPGQPVVIVADHDGLKQLVVNLLLNAHEATPPTGTITLELSAESHAAILTVSDTGEGIAPDLLEQIFDPFVTTKPHGTGLGLAISAGMAAQYGGSLRAANNVSAGACFTLIGEGSDRTICDNGSGDTNATGGQIAIANLVPGEYTVRLTKAGKVSETKLKVGLDRRAKFSDADRKVMTAYGAYGEKMMYGKKTVGVIRSTVWIGPDGKVRKHWARVADAAKHPEQVLAALEDKE